ncbi:Rha family transcriptional regulator [Enterobacter ludwigii]|uniref:Rha family transcriptional regulator n=1 Tax=Enterobacter ludwigii TaxID=299767 RepID=UPI0030765AE6|nr:Rha family transcriptional regulator [Enterobacter ludwigii]HDR2600111.1 Rha family transcriptional regulator [Enterobacter ludwigii]
MTNAISAVIPEITIHDGRAVTTSVALANYFQKRHDDVVRKIRGLISECRPSYHLRNFTEMVRDVPGGDGAVRKMPMYELTRDAFVLIVMGFTGKKALQWKIDYIEAFNRMEAELTNQYPVTSPVMPVFPVDTDFSYLTTVKNGHVAEIRLVNRGQILAHYSDFVEMVQRTGSVVIDEAELRSLSSEAIITLCEAARRSRSKWEKLHCN